MTGLLWRLTWLPLVLTAVSNLPPPSNLRVTLNMSGYVLRWEPGAGTPPGTSFSVTISGRRLSGCQRVRNPLICNLTEAFREMSESYDVQVTAELGNRTSQPSILNSYTPIHHLPLPGLNMSTCSLRLCVDFLPPYPNLRQHYQLIGYELQITSGDVGQPTLKKFWSLERQNLNLVPDRNHCVSIRFADTLLRLQSNFSRPSCILIPGSFNPEPLFAVLLCLLVLTFVCILALLFRTGFICLKRRPLPSVLTSIQHLEDVWVAFYSGSLVSLHNIWLMPPPVDTNHTSMSEETDESCTNTSGRNSLAEKYTVRLGSNLRSSPSSASSSSSQPDPPPSSCRKQAAEGTPPHPEVLVFIEHNPLRTDGSSGVSGEEEEEEEEEDGKVNVAETVGQDVDLLTLTFAQPGRTEEEDDEELGFSASPIGRPSQPGAAGASSSPDDDVEDEEAINVIEMDAQDVCLLTLTFAQPESHNEEEEENDSHASLLVQPGQRSAGAEDEDDDDDDDDDDAKNYSDYMCRLPAAVF